MKRSSSEHKETLSERGSAVGQDDEVLVGSYSFGDVLREEEKVFEVPLLEDGIDVCCSGGGIRSAGFCLGGLLALNPNVGEAVLLPDRFSELGYDKSRDFNNKATFEKVSYLSSVSGGGYLCSSLMLRLAEERENGVQHAAAHDKALEDTANVMFKKSYYMTGMSEVLN